jgi:hypothetical protein
MALLQRLRLSKTFDEHSYKAKQTQLLTILKVFHISFHCEYGLPVHNSYSCMIAISITVSAYKYVFIAYFIIYSFL